MVRGALRWASGLAAVIIDDIMIVLYLSLYFTWCSDYSIQCQCCSPSPSRLDGFLEVRVRVSLARSCVSFLSEGSFKISSKANKGYSRVRPSSYAENIDLVTSLLGCQNCVG